MKTQIVLILVAVLGFADSLKLSTWNPPDALSLIDKKIHCSQITTDFKAQYPEGDSQKVYDLCMAYPSSGKEVQQ